MTGTADLCVLCKGCRLEIVGAVRNGESNYWLVVYPLNQPYVKNLRQQLGLSMSVLLGSSFMRGGVRMVPWSQIAALMRNGFASNGGHPVLTR